MKKSFLFCLFLVVCVFLTGCTMKKEDTDFSLAQKEVLSDCDDNFYVQIVSGTRETPFLIDGVTKKTEDFTTLTVLPLHFDMFDKEYTFSVIGDKGSFEGVLTSEKTGSGYSADIKAVSSLGKITSLEIKATDTTYTFNPESKQGEFSYFDAYEKGKETFASTLETEMESGISREVVVKFVSEGKGKDSPFYWYVAFMRSDNDFLSVLLDGNTGEIIAQRG